MYGREPETKSVMKWIIENPFVMSLNFHDGAIVASYPWDDSKGVAPSGEPSLTGKQLRHSMIRGFYTKLQKLSTRPLQD